MTPVVSMVELTKSYGRVRGIESVDLQLNPGEVFGFIGPNGAGKTTTIRLLMDFIRPTSGSASIFGLDVHRSAVEIHARVGYLPADIALFDRMTASDLFRWLGRLRGNFDPAYVNELVERLDLDPSRSIEELSTGNRQKVGVIQAFMHRPELLMLDEPTSGLDPFVRRQFRELVKEAKRSGSTVFLSSHELTEVEDICDRVGIIVGGRMRSVETMAVLRESVRRHVHVLLAPGVDFNETKPISGVSNLAVLTSNNGRGIVLEMDVAGPLDHLIKTLANYRVVDLVSEPLSLEDYFLEAYDNGHPGSSSREDAQRNSKPAAPEVSHVG
ncbi:MAG: ABC transporter ATP-binding protein [Acidimicrobiales bacterium]|nr:ABC transporter ATP-binding protein [Acidimicrobiales bacterium]